MESEEMNNKFHHSISLQLGYGSETVSTPTGWHWLAIKEINYCAA